MMTAETLRTISYFEALDASSLEELARRVRQRAVGKGETIVTEGGRCEGLYFVVRGRVKVFKLSGEGKEQVLRILETGRTFNDVPVFDGGPNPASIEALEPSEVAFVPRGDILALVDRHPRMAAGVIRVLASRLRALTLVIEDLSFRSVVARVAKLLLDCSRGEPTLVEGAASACASLTQQQIAAMTGSVREVVQRALKTLEREGAIRMHRAQVVVLDPKILERLSDSLPG
jgi:CRP/FNR family transcriptional regulator